MYSIAQPFKTLTI